MTTHSRVRRILYEYLRDELSKDDRESAEAHLHECRKCAKDLEELRSLVDVPLHHLRAAAEERGAEYWRNFPTEVERRIHSPGPAKTNSFREEWEALVSWLLMRNRSFVAAGGAIAVIIVVVLVWKPFSHTDVKEVAQPARHMETEPAESPSSPDVVQADERVGQYFRKSRALLVGLTNMKLDDEQSLDLSTEQTVSRELVHEARYLKSQPIDMRSARLIGDLERILIELANLKEEHDIPNVEIIRAGIHQENLLFKIRMAETRFDSSRYRTVKNSY